MKFLLCSKCNKYRLYENLRIDNGMFICVDCLNANIKDIKEVNIDVIRELRRRGLRHEADMILNTWHMIGKKNRRVLKKELTTKINKKLIFHKKQTGICITKYCNKPMHKSYLFCKEHYIISKYKRKLKLLDTVYILNMLFSIKVSYNGEEIDIDWRQIKNG